MAMKTLNEWVDGLQAVGRYTFRREEALSATGRSAEAVGKALRCLTKRGRLAKVKEYFYVIVPLEYSVAGAPPAAWFIRDLMAAMGRPYYVGLLSAAALHGASHQQPQEFQVVTSKFVRPLRVGRARIRFFTKRSCEATATTSAKAPTGPMRVSTPEATAIDLVRYAKSVGHFAHVATVLREMSSTLNGRDLLEAAKAEGNVMAAQRLGYLLERIGGGKIAESMASWLRAHDLHAVALRPDRPANRKDAHPLWRVIPNEILEIEA